MIEQSIQSDTNDRSNVYAYIHLIGEWFTCTRLVAYDLWKLFVVSMCVLQCDKIIVYWNVAMVDGCCNLCCSFYFTIRSRTRILSASFKDLSEKKHQTCRSVDAILHLDWAVACHACCPYWYSISVVFWAVRRVISWGWVFYSHLLASICPSSDDNFNLLISERKTLHWGTLI